MSSPFINNIKDLYLVKTDHYNSSQAKVGDSLNFDFNCLVMDYHSIPDWYENGRATANNWRLNLNFYKIIINLAKNYPQVNFLIKSKNYKWIDIPIFKEIYGTFIKSKNILI